MRFDGLLLRDLRRRKALTTKELAALAGVSSVAVNEAENGHREPRASTLRKLAGALNVSTEVFFSDREDIPLPAPGGEGDEAR